MTRIAIVTLDTFGAKMAGPAIRVWEMARLLGREHDVTVLTFANADRPAEGFSLRSTNVARFRDDLADPDVVIIQGFLMRTFPWLADMEARLVIDLYDPFHLECLGVDKHEAMPERRASLAHAVGELDAQIGAGDFFLCASEIQRSLWLGHLAARGRINPATYDADPSLENLLAVAPFGIDLPAPAITDQPIRKRPGIGQDDPVLLWGGGIYNWFDPLTVIRAVDLARERIPNLRLYFLGAKHPHPDVPQMAMAAKARELSDELGLTGTHVFFGEEWVDYSMRHNYLLDSAIGVSAHFADIETRFSFRTRILDCLWAGLPIITTTGDVFADLVEERQLGAAVPVEDPAAFAEAIVRVLAQRDEMSARVTEVATEFAWQTTLARLVEYCRDPQPAADRAWRAERLAAPTATPPRASVRGLARKTVHSLRSGGVRHTAEKIRGYLRRR